MVESDEEQLEVLKNWWKENGQSIVIAIALAFFGYFGFKSWEAKIKSAGEEASAIYQQLLDLNLKETEKKTLEQQRNLQREQGMSDREILKQEKIQKEKMQGNAWHRRLKTNKSLTLKALNPGVGKVTSC